jgi:hypothetical protein
MHIASLLCSILLSCVACPALPYFSILSHKRQDFRKKLYNIKLRADISTSLSETFLITRRIQRAIIINVRRPSYKVLFLSHINENRIFAKDFRKKSDIRFHENPFGWIRVGPCGMSDRLKDRQTDTMKLIVAFRNFATPSNKNAQQDIGSH